MLRNLDLKPVYDSDNHDLVRDLQVPLLREASDYLRGVGFFTSGWLRLAAEGIVSLVETGGRARIVTSPVLDGADLEALQSGNLARDDKALRETLRNSIRDLRESLDSDTWNTLAWMVSDGVLELRFAVPRSRESAGMYHDKVAVFTDTAYDSVAIHGSLNDSIQGSLNGEAFSVFKSWESAQSEYVAAHYRRLEALWDDRNGQFRVACMDEALKAEFIRLRVTQERPYLWESSSAVYFGRTGPKCAVSLRDYQSDAISRWMEAERRGVLEMATGTGKTVTALAAASTVYEREGRLALIVLVPYIHLMEQWADNCRRFGFSPVLCSGSQQGWQHRLRDQIMDFRIGAKNHLCAIAVHNTGARADFRRIVSNLKAEETLLIGDEVHGLGAPHLRSALTPSAGMRLGLSATPRRWFDEEGTAAIFRYFGDTCYRLELKQAIGTFLTPYEYYPIPVSLDDDETDRYETLTRRIIQLRAGAENDPDAREQMKRLLIERSRIVYGASAKLPELLRLLGELISDHRKQNDSVRGVLVFCAPGKHLEVLRAVAGTGLRCHEFVHTVGPSDRAKLLEQFDAGDIQVLVAVRCLDEGVDVPSTRTAFVMASSTNPREFVQRRGRILRLFPGKSVASIYDFVVAPPKEARACASDADISVLRREMPRFAEFADCAKNPFAARRRLWDVVDRAGMLHLLDMKPWDLYHELKGWDWNEDE
jgi:superfamily II DNA or RNA helicase